MILESIIKFLENYLGVPVAAELYDGAPEEIVVINLAGEDRENLISTAQIVASSFSGSMLGAAQLNESVKAALDNLIDLDEVSSSRLVTSYQASETATKRYRYQAVYNITHY